MRIEAMKQALEALEYAQTGNRRPEVIGTAITDLRTAIVEAEKQEPVAWQGVHDKTDLYYRKPVQGDVRPLYTTPPAAQRTWVGLTEKDFSAINQSCLTKLQAATSAESILKEKNT